MIGCEKTTCPLAVDYFVSRINPLFTDIIGHSIDQGYLSNKTITVREIVIENNPKDWYTNADLQKLEYSSSKQNWVDNSSNHLWSKNQQMELDNGHSHSFLRRSGASYLQMYMDPKFVTGITVPGVEMLAKDMEHEHKDELEEGGSYSIAHSSDSDSLHVDEELFNSAYFPKDRQESENIDWSSVDVVQSSEENVNVVPSSSSSSYDPVKDLYEILSNSKERLVVTQALKGTYKEPILRNWMESHMTSIGNSSRYSRVDDDVIPSVATSSSSSQDAPPLPERGFRSFQPPSNNLQNSGVLQVSDLIDNLPLYNAGHATASNGQHPSTTRVVVNTENYCSGFFKWMQPFRKHFENRRTMETAKIIATTFLGLIAFGVITALSLGINRV